MKRLAIVVGCVMAVGIPPSLNGESRADSTRAPQAATRGEPELPPDAVQATSCRKAIAQQNRINRYFHRGVVPRMARCWAGLGGSGSVAAQFTFRRSGTYWLPGSSRLRRSTLPATSDGPAALQCLESAMAGTVLPVEASDAEATELRVNWSFPVPWPSTLDAAAQRMIDGGGGPGPNECGGSEGPEMACVDCFYLLGYSFCGPSCTGYSGCSRIDHGCQMTLPLCVTGSAFGNIGGLLIY